MVTNLRDKVQFFPDVVAGLVLGPVMVMLEVHCFLSPPLPCLQLRWLVIIMTQHGAENRDRIEKIQLEFLLI